MDDSNKVKHRRKHLLRYHNLGAFTSPMWQTAKLVSRTYLSPVTSIFLFMHNYSQLYFKNQKQTSLSLHSVSQLPCSLMENERAKSDSPAMCPEITYLVHMYPDWGSGMDRAERTGELTSQRSVWSKEQQARSGARLKGTKTEASRGWSKEHVISVIAASGIIIDQIN